MTKTAKYKSGKPNKINKPQEVVNNQKTVSIPKNRRKKELLGKSNKLTNNK